MKPLIIIPTYNEKANIVNLLGKIFAVLPTTHVVVVDDASPDGTADDVRWFTATTQQPIHLIERTDVRGLGGAYKAGFVYGLTQDYDVLVTMDADLSHNPGYLPAIVDATQQYDLVIGSRYIPGGCTRHWEPWRILLSWCANTFARVALDLHEHDLTSGYRAYRRKILECINLDVIRSNGYSFLVEMLFYAHQHHAIVGEVPIEFVDRTMGTSKISKREIYLGALTLLRLRFSRQYSKA